jgi:FHA domain
MATSEIAQPRPASARELKAVLDAERSGRPFLLYRDGDGGQQLRLLDESTNWLTLGRSSEADVPLAWDERVSAVHAELHRAGGVWTLADDGLSTNGTFVNGARLTGRRRLRDGDCVLVGRTAVVFRLAAAAAPVPGTVAGDEIPTVEQLSPTQRRVLVALCRPYRDGDRYALPATNQQIAGEVFLGVDAVKTHLRALFAKFGLETLPQNEKRVRLAERALEWGLVRRGDL